MYNYEVQQDDIDILRQSSRPTYIRAELLNSDMQVVDSIQGQLVDDNFSCTEESSVRRTYNCTFEVVDSSYKIGRDKKIWFGRFIKVYYGVKNIRTKTIRWYTIGVFSFVDADYSFTTTDRTVSLSCSDLMSTFDGTLSGVMTYDSESQVTFKVEPGQTVYSVIQGLLEFAGITNYSITGVVGYTIPYEIEWEYGTTFCEAWEKIRDLYDIWEFFFDEDGRFIWRQTLTGYGEGIVLDDSIIKPLIISESYKNTFQNVFNATEVWGQELDIVEDDRYTDKCTGGTSLEDNVFNITLQNYIYSRELYNEVYFKWSEYKPWEDGSTVHLYKAVPGQVIYNSMTKYCSSIYTYTPVAGIRNLNDKCFTEYNIDSGKYLVFRDDSCATTDDFKRVLTDNSITISYGSIDNFDSVAIKVSGAYGKYININGTGNIPILNSSGTDFEDKKYKPNTVYVFRYRRTKNGDDLYVIDPNFYLMGQFQAHGYYEETNINTPYSIPNLGKKIVKVIEDDSYYSDEICQNQAQYETYKSTAKQDTISLNTIIIPFLEPSQKIKYTPQASGVTDEWIVQNLSWSTKSGTMSLDLYRFNEDYSYVKRREQEK